MALGDLGRVDRPSSGSHRGNQFGHDRTGVSGLAARGGPPHSNDRESRPRCCGLLQSSLWRDSGWLPHGGSRYWCLSWASRRACRMRGGRGGIGQELSRRGHSLTRERSKFALKKRAEREGLEPSDPVSQVNSLAVSPIRPLSHLSLRTTVVDMLPVRYIAGLTRSTSSTGLFGSFKGPAGHR